jgi:hypothetical protein
MIIQKQPEVCYKFIKENRGADGIVTVPPKKIEITLNDEVDLECLLETFQEFLIASGFVLNHDEIIAIVKETSEEREDEDEGDSEI